MVILVVAVNTAAQKLSRSMVSNSTKSSVRQVPVTNSGFSLLCFRRSDSFLQMQSIMGSQLLLFGLCLHICVSLSLWYRAVLPITICVPKSFCQFSVAVYWMTNYSFTLCVCPTPQLSLFGKNWVNMFHLFPSRHSIIWKSDLTDKMKRSFFQAAVVSILLYGCTTWTLTKRLERRLDGNYTRMLRAVLNKSWRQHPTRLQLYGHLPPITKTIQVRRTRHAGHCWRSKDELISDVLLWTPAHGCAGVGRPARTYIQQLCEDTGCNPEDLPEAMDDREKWRETVRDIRAGGATWWWWWYLINGFFLNLFFSNYLHSQLLQRWILVSATQGGRRVSSHFHVSATVPFSLQERFLHHITHMSCPANYSLPKSSEKFQFLKV